MFTRTLIGSLLVALAAVGCHHASSQPQTPTGSIEVALSAATDAPTSARLVIAALDGELRKSVVVGSGAAQRLQLPPGSYALEVAAAPSAHADPDALAAALAAPASRAIIFVAPERVSKVHLEPSIDHDERLARFDAE